MPAIEGGYRIRSCAGVGVGAALVFSVAACSPTFDGAPSRIQNDPRVAFQQESYSADALRSYRNSAGTDRRDLRNSIVLSTMGAMDIQYTKFEQELTKERQGVPFLATVASIGLSGAGSLVADASTKTALAVVDTALKGTKAAYDKEILGQQTIGFIQSQMRTNRNNVRTRILTQLSLPVEKYPLELAFIDLEEYYTAGTITAGLTGINAEASANLRSSEELKVLTVATYGADENTIIIRNYLATGGDAAVQNLQGLSCGTTNIRTTCSIPKWRLLCPIEG